MELMQASKQWFSRPADERFLSLTDMKQHFDHIRDHSKESVVSSRKIEVLPTDDNKGLVIQGPKGVSYGVTHWAFGQVAQLAQAPAAYLCTIPSPLAADCVNYGLKFQRRPEDVGVLLYKNGGDPVLRAATGPRYGRIWNADILTALVSRFGNGIDGDFRVPGEFGVDVEVTKANTTLYAGDRDMFVFLADEKNRIEVPNRRDGKSGTMARGFFMWNSEVGKCTYGLATFLFDYACCNRIVWGADQYREITIRHTASAPDRYIEEVAQVMLAYANSSATPVIDAIKLAQKQRIDDVDKFLQARFTKHQSAAIQKVHMEEEDKPIETLWDATTGITAWAKNISHQDTRVDAERIAGNVLDLAA